MKSNEQWRSADLEESNTGYPLPSNFQSCNFDHFYIEKLILSWNFGLLLENSFWQGSWMYLSLSLRFSNAKDILRFNKLNVSTWYIKCIILYSLGCFYLLLHILHISCFLVKILTCYHRELIFLNIAGLCKNIFIKCLFLVALASFLSAHLYSFKSVHMYWLLCRPWVHLVFLLMLSQT